MTDIHVRKLVSMLVVAVFAVLSGAPVLAGPAHQTDSPATPLERPVTAVGMVELNGIHQVVLETGGRIDLVRVEVGDEVDADDLLLRLETTDLSEAVAAAELSVEKALIDLEELTKEPEPSAVALAEARLLQAQEQLELVEAGPTEEEMEAAANAAQAAWARYEELRAGPRASQITLARANLAQAEVDLQEAQREYDKIAWLPEAAATSAAENLQRSTIAYEAATAAFDEASRAATAADLLGALSTAQSAQHGLNRLEEKPTPAELADARAALASASHELDELTKGPEDADVRKAELSLQEAQMGLAKAQQNLENATVRAPIAGTIITLNAETGQQGSSGALVATLGDMSDLKLVVNVEQTDITRIVPGQPVDVSLYAIPDRTIQGTVDRIAPVSDTSTGTVTFPVTIQLTDDDLTNVRPGMTASAIFLSEPPEDAEQE